MADELRLNLGALRSAMQLTLHTHHASRIWHGRARSDERDGIVGLNGFILIMNKMKRGAEQDDPYSDWWMIKIEEKLDDTKKRLQALREQVDQVLADVPPALTLGDNLNVRGGLIFRAQRLLSQATVYPFNQLPVELALQTTGAGTAFLRWRNTDRSAMGVSLWVDLMGHANTPLPLVHELFALEMQRIALNMQISLTHSIARQALDCAQKMAQAEAVYETRINPSAPTTPKETRS